MTLYVLGSSVKFALSVFSLEGIEVTASCSSPPPLLPSFVTRYNARCCIELACAQALDAPETDELLTGSSSFVADSRQRGKEGQFSLRKELIGHTAAVYVTKYSNSGSLLASGSLDQTVRLWDTLKHTQVAVLEGHTNNIADITWSQDSQLLMTGSFDKTVKVWRPETADLDWSHTLDGLVHSVAFHSTDANFVLASTSKKKIHGIDRRGGEDSTYSLANDSIVNSILMDGDNLLITGDSSGVIKTWDLRMREVIDTVMNEEFGRPISHIALSPGLPISSAEAYDDNARCLAVNSYDNVLRVYDRTDDQPPSLKRVQALTGQTAKNWPVRCAFFRDAVASSVAVGDELEGPSGGGNSASSNALGSRQGAALLLASGSADSVVRLFDVGSGSNSNKLFQKLEGHTDRVYAVDFHPEQAMLASGSADATIRIWARKRAR